MAGEEEEGTGAEGSSACDLPPAEPPVAGPLPGSRHGGGGGDGEGGGPQVKFLAGQGLLLPE